MINDRERAVAPTSSYKLLRIALVAFGAVMILLYPLAVLTLPDDLAAHARGTTADPAGERIFSVHGRNAWKSRLRAHPDVAAAHRYV